MSDESRQGEEAMRPIFKWMEQGFEMIQALTTMPSDEEANLIAHDEIRKLIANAKGNCTSDRSFGMDGMRTMMFGALDRMQQMLLEDE